MYSSLRVKTPPADEPITLAEAKTHLRVDNAADDDYISGLITAARWLVEGWSSRALIDQDLIWTFSQSPPTGSLPLLPMPLLILPIILSAPTVLAKPLELPRSPVSAVNSITVTHQDGTTVDTLADGTDYVVDLNVDPARIRLQWLTIPRYIQHMQIDFSAGYAANDLPPPVIQAIKITLTWLYERRGDDGGEMPPAIEYLIAPYKVQYFA